MVEWRGEEDRDTGWGWMVYDTTRYMTLTWAEE